MRGSKALGEDTTQEYGTPIVPGPYVPDMPDRLIVLTATPGPGYVMEAAADAGAFQLRCRGRQNDPADAEQIAYAADSLILNAPFPARTGSGQVIVHVHRLGGTPAPLSGSPDDGDRYELTASYVAIAST